MPSNKTREERISRRKQLYNHLPTPWFVFLRFQVVCLCSLLVYSWLKQLDSKKWYFWFFLFLFFSAELIDFLCLAKVICIGYKLMAASCIFIVLLFLLAFILLVYVRPCPFIFISFWVNVVHVEPLKISIGAIVAIMFFFFVVGLKRFTLNCIQQLQMSNGEHTLKFRDVFLLILIDRLMVAVHRSKAMPRIEWIRIDRKQNGKERQQWKY